MNKDEFDANLVLSVEPKQELNGSLEMLKNQERTIFIPSTGR